MLQMYIRNIDFLNKNVFFINPWELFLSHKYITQLPSLTEHCSVWLWQTLCIRFLECEETRHNVYNVVQEKIIKTSVKIWIQILF